jgi:CcmD family protein
MMRRIALWFAFAWLCAGGALISTTASADDGQNTGQNTNGDRAASFQAVEGGTQEDVAGGPLMLLAYAAVWLVVFGYVYRINRLQRGVEANLERLERSIASQGSST